MKIFQKHLKVKQKIKFLIEIVKMNENSIQRLRNIETFIFIGNSSPEAFK